MILLQIKRASKFNPIKYKSESLAELPEGHAYMQSIGDHPNNPEFGTVEISTNVIQGDLNNIAELTFATGADIVGELVKWKKGFWGNHKIEVNFNTVYKHGLKYSAQEFIVKGGLIVGLTPDEKQALSQIGGQKELLSLLADYIIPSRKSDVLNFAKPCLLCQPNDKNNEAESHFLGKPKHQLPKRLFHLATLNLKELPNSIIDLPLVQYLSFYLKISDTDKGWPESKEDFKISNTQMIEEPPTVTQKAFENARNIEFQELLDLPGEDHPIIHVLKFSEDEKRRIDVLKSAFMQLLIGDDYLFESVNKFFGYPDSVQNNVAYEAERIYNKRDYSDEIYKDAIDWELLLQVSPYCEWFEFFDEFGDGTIYFMIRKDDLQNGNFENCQLVVQNT